MTVSIEKIPMLQCDKCGGNRVIKTESGIECHDCGSDNTQCKDITLNLTNDIEYLVYALNNKEI